MKDFVIGTLDQVMNWFCDFGPLRFVGSWWWRRRLADVHSHLQMESYHRLRD